MICSGTAFHSIYPTFSKKMNSDWIFPFLCVFWDERKKRLPQVDRLIVNSVAVPCVWTCGVTSWWIVSISRTENYPQIGFWVIAFFCPWKFSAWAEPAAVPLLCVPLVGTPKFVSKEWVKFGWYFEPFFPNEFPVKLLNAFFGSNNNRSINCTVTIQSIIMDWVREAPCIKSDLSDNTYVWVQL